MVKNLPAMQKTLVRSMGKEDALEKGMAITPVFLPGEFHGQRSLAGYSPWGHKEWEKARAGCFKRTASKHVYYQG